MIVNGHFISVRWLEKRETLNRPAQQRRAYSEPGADRSQQNQVALLQSAFLARGVHGQRNRSRSCISIPVNIDNDALRLQPESFAGGIDDSLVRLVRNKAIDVAGLYAISL